MAFRHCIALLAIIGCASALAAFDVPAWGGMLQNVAWPTKCISFTDTGVQVVTCDRVLLNEYFDFTNFQSYATTPGVITSLYNSKILEVVNSNPNNGAAIGAATYDSNNVTLNQKWKIIGPGLSSWDGTFELQVEHSNKCLNCQGVGGTSLDVWECFADPRQTWRVIQFPRVPTPHHVLIRSIVGFQNGGLDNFCATNLDYADVSLSVISSPAWWNLQWYVDEVQGNNATIRNYGSNKCLQVNGGATTYQARITQLTCPSPVDAGPGKFYWNVQTSDPVTAGAGRRWQFVSANAPGMCLGLETYGSTGSVAPYTDVACCQINCWVGTIAAIRPCVDSIYQLFFIDQPANYLQTFGTACVGPLACLSNSCNVVCQKGATGLPCQTKNDCASAVCSNGNCT